MLVPVAHFQREPYSTFGNPFLIKIKEGETYEEIKERIRSHIDVPEKDFEKYGSKMFFHFWRRVPTSHPMICLKKHVGIFFKTFSKKILLGKN